MTPVMGLLLMAAAFMLAAVSAVMLIPRRSALVERRLAESGTADGLDLPGQSRRAGPGPLTRLLAFAATLAPGSFRGQELRDQLAGAGWYGADSVRIFLGSKVLLCGLGALAFAGLAFVTHQAPARQALWVLLGGVGGFQLPSIVLWNRSSRRRSAIRLALPDALDLLVVCVESGLGLNAAIVRVGRELRWNCPPLSEELRTVNQEIRAGMPRTQALRNFARRVPITDVQSLAAMFIQTDRLGTSIARSLRVHADTLRTKRRQRAEERARKATIKLIFPLVFFVFPELLVVILGPAGIQILSTLREMAGR